MVATSHLWLLSTQNVVSEAEEMDYKFHLILIVLNRKKAHLDSG